MLKGASVFFSAEAFDIFSQGEDLESCGGVSWGDLLENPDDLSDCELETRTDVCAVLVVTDVLVSPSSVALSVGMVSPWIRNGNFLNRSPFSFSSIVLEENRGEMSYEGTPVKARPNTRRRMMPPTPQQSSHSLIEEMYHC